MARSQTGFRKMAAALVEVGDFERGVIAGSDWRHNAPAELLTEFETFADMLQQLPRWALPGLLEGFVAVRSEFFIGRASPSYALGFCHGASCP
jgi:hypothetical protein